MDEYILAKYTRLSTEDSRSDSQSIENQRLMLGKYIADMDIPNVTVLEFVDNGYSGTNFERPAIQELLDLVRDGKIDCIIVKDFSRFGRNAIETGYFLERVFPLYHTRFISVCDYYDSAEHEGSTGGIEVALKFLVHEHYSRDLSKKIKAAKHERMSRGEYIHKNCAFGYVKTKDNRMEIDPDAAETVRLIFSLALENKSLSEIKRRLYNEKHLTPASYKKRAQKITQETDFDYIWNTSAIQAILENEQYAGTYIAGKTKAPVVGSRVRTKADESEWVKIPNHHPAIINREQFEAARAVVNKKGRSLRGGETNLRERHTVSPTSPLASKVVCDCYGHKMALNKAENAAFQCKFTRSAPNIECHGLRILKSELESALFDIISKQAQAVLNVDSLNEVSAVTLQNVRQSECKRSIEQANDAKRSLYEQFTLGEIKPDEYMNRKMEIDAEIDRLNRVHAALTEQISQKQREAEASAKLSDAISGESGLSQSLVDLLIEKVRVYPDNRIEVEWKITGLHDNKIELPA